ncbi:MAG: nuclease-related domain-containing protein [Nitrososphaerota archaeon]
MGRGGLLGRPMKISSVERNVLLCVLRTSRVGPIFIETVKEWSGSSRDVVRRVFEKFNLKDGEMLGSDDLLRIAVTLFGMNVSPEVLSVSLDWSLFEELTSRIFENAGLNIMRNIQISIGKNKTQIDLLAFNEDTLYIVECKRWRRSITIGLIKTIESAMKRRILIMREFLSKTIGEGEFEIRLIPLLLTVYGSPYFDDVLFHSPLRTLKSFLSEPAVSLPSPPLLKMRLKEPLMTCSLQSPYLKHLRRRLFD